MLVPFETLPSASRIWIYQADRKISEAGKELISKYLNEYCSQWSAHGQPLRTSYQIAEDHFIILAVDESIHDASGCSIDTSVNALKDITRQTGIDFFNREMIAFKNEDIVLIPLRNLKDKYSEKIWNASTFAFNNTITEKGQLETQWLKPAGETWLRRYIPAAPVKLG
jgi:hypothetical protein